MVIADYYSYSLFDFIIYHMVDHVIIRFLFYRNNRKNLLKIQNFIELSTNFNSKKISLNFYLCKNLKTLRYIYYI